MSTKYNWTTGPISASSDQVEVRILVLNNTSYTRQASVRVYDLAATPKDRVFDDTFTLRPWETMVFTIPTHCIHIWEVQGTAYSDSVRFYVAGRNAHGINTPGNTILNSEFIRF